MIEHSAIDHIQVIDGGVFRRISVDTAIFVVEAGTTTAKQFSINHSTPREIGLIEDTKSNVSITAVRKHSHYLFVGQRDDRISLLWDRIGQICIPLKSVAYVNFGKQLRHRKKFRGDVIKVSEIKQIPKDYRPCYTGKDVTRYHINWNNLACLNTEIARTGGCWNAERQDAKDKLITRQIGKHPIFGLDFLGYQCLNTVFMINVFAAGYDPGFLLGLVNSKLLEAYWKENFYDQRRTFPKVKGTYLKQLPIRLINFSDPADKKRHDTMVTKVDAMLEAKKQLAKAKTDKHKTYYENKCTALDRQIDQLVYKLYDLTDEEIEIVEQASGSQGT